MKCVRTKTEFFWIPPSFIFTTFCRGFIQIDQLIVKVERKVKSAKFMFDEPLIN